MDMQAMSDREVLEQLIGVRSTDRLYKGQLLVFACGVGGSTPHPKVAAAMELARRVMREELARGPVLSTPLDVCEYLRAHFVGREYEAFVCLFLDVRHRLIRIEEMFRGSLCGAEVHPREIVKRALALNAGAVILSHNHPSGVAEPSTADRAVTTRVRDALALVDVRVLDHIVVGGMSTTSFAERGML